MRFLELHIKSFGKFHDRTISFQDGLNVVYGKNEAGKSTIHTFIRGMLFGIQPQRGRASKNDLYSKYEPWENSGAYEGSLRLEKDGHIYRIERSFQKTKKELHIIDETLGKSLSPTKALLDELLCGLSETAYNNTISIGQLKSATEAGMVSELKNYIANMNTTGSMALNITRATDYLKKQKKQLEAQLVPEAARSYTSLLGEIKTLEKEISSPEYENQLPAYQQMKLDTRSKQEAKQAEKEGLLQKVARGRQVLSQNKFSDIPSIQSYLEKTQEVYKDYETTKARCEKKSRRFLQAAAFVLATCCLAFGIYVYCLGDQNPISRLFAALHENPPNYLTIYVLAASAGAAALLYLSGLLSLWKGKGLVKELALSSQVLTESFTRHLGDGTISREAMNAFVERMMEFQRLSAAMDKSDETIRHLTAEINGLQEQQNNYSEFIEKQQKQQWELEKKLELLSNYKTQMEVLRRTLAENERISQELAAIDLAQDTMTELSASIRDSFGLYLNKTASELIGGITGGIYTSMSIDENLGVFMNTPSRLVPLEQVSSGTMDQIYLALRLAAARLIQSEQRDHMPLIFDDSFVLYDEDRLKSALKWLCTAYTGQIIIFTCHQREAQMLTANQIPYHLVQI
ncbi:MAG: AAA family ATPase [Hungatella sp.]|nr:AAA family ATPase [Hungatella sp.]